VTVRRTAAARRPMPTPAADREIAESGGSWFEEASDHAVVRPRNAGLRLGPVSPISGGGMVPGVLGWRRAVRAAAAGARSTADLYYLVGRSSPTAKGPSPIREFDWSDFAVVVASNRPVPGTVLARAPAQEKPQFRRLVADVVAELADIDD
jgi:hypothetical protein